MVGYSSTSGSITPNNPKKSAKGGPHRPNSTTTAANSQNLNSQNFTSQKSSAKPKSSSTNNKNCRSNNNPRPVILPTPPRCQRQNSSPRPVPPPARARHSSSSSSNMSISPCNTPNSFRSTYSPSRTSPTSFASSMCYQAPTPSSLPLPPVHWTCKAPLDPSEQLKLLLNVQA